MEREATTQEELDGLVAHKLRVGGAGDLTLRELQQASPELIPTGVLQQALQDVFTRLDQEVGVFAVEWKGADLTFSEGEDQPTLVIMVDTGEIEERFIHPGVGMVPALRFWINDNWVETNADGGIDEGG